MDKWSWKKRYQRSRGVCFSFQKKKEEIEKGHIGGSWVNCTNFFPQVFFFKRDSLKVFISLSFSLY